MTEDVQLKTYDGDGKMLTASNINGTYTFSYDSDSRVTNVQEPFAALIPGLEPIYGDAVSFTATGSSSRMHAGWHHLFLN